MVTGGYGILAKSPNAEDDCFDLRALQEKPYACRNDVRRISTADQMLNAYRDRF